MTATVLNSHHLSGHTQSRCKTQKSAKLHQSFPPPSVGHEKQICHFASSLLYVYKVSNFWNKSPLWNFTNNSFLSTEEQIQARHWSGYTVWIESVPETAGCGTWCYGLADVVFVKSWMILEVFPTSVIPWNALHTPTEGWQIPHLNSHAWLLFPGPRAQLCQALPCKEGDGTACMYTGSKPGSSSLQPVSSLCLSHVCNLGTRQLCFWHVQ